MAQTFKDFIMECELYEHSREKFELMKECSELALTEKYLNDQLFMAENAELINSRRDNLEEGFFQESVGDSTFEIITEKYFEKEKGIKGKILRGIEKIVKVFGNFLRKIANKFDDITSKGQSVRNRLAKAKLTDDHISNIQKLVDNTKSKEETNFPVMANQPYLSKVKLGNYTASEDSVSKLTNDITAALSDTVVVADVTVNSKGTGINKDMIGALPAETIKEAASRVSRGGLDELKGLKVTISSTWATVQKSGLKIKVNINEITKLVDELNQISTTISEIYRNETDKASALGTTTKDAAENMTGKPVPFEGTEPAKMAEDITSELTSAIGQSMKLYASLNGYRASIINGLDSILENTKE